MWAKVKCPDGRVVDWETCLACQGSANAHMRSSGKSLAGMVEGIKFTQQRKAELFTNLKMLMEQGRLKLSEDRILFSHLNAVEYHHTSSGGLKFTHPEGTHDDAAVALALACWAASRPSGAGCQAVG